jgi:hypothetical protein
MTSNQFPVKLPFSAFTISVSFAAVLSVGAQTIALRSPQPRTTVPLNSTVSTLISNQVTLSGVTNVDLNVSGVLSIAGGGCEAILSTNSRTNSGPVFITLNTTNVSQGLYTFSLNASGLDTNGVPRTNHLLFILQAGFVWNGTNNAALGGAGSWSDSTKWLGGAAPGPGDDVIFTDRGGQTNSVVSTPAITNLLVNSVVTVNTTVGSLRFSQTNSSTAFHTLRIDPGRKLSITGTNGFSVLRDQIAPFAGIGAPINVTIVGTNATMMVSNQSANFALLADGNVVNIFDMSRLQNLAVDVNRVGLGDASLWPHYFNFEANEYGGVPSNLRPTVSMARTNIITARYVNPYGMTNADEPFYSICFVNSINQGSGTISLLSLGITNAFLADSVCFVGANSAGNVIFNPAFATNTPCYAYFRAADGGRMTMFAVSDCRGTNAASQNTRLQGLNFGANGGSVDILADKFIVARDRRFTVNDQNYQGYIYLGKGLVDVNDAALGFQDGGGHTNLGIPDDPNPNKPFRGYCQGILIVSNSAVFKVNRTLDLGYTTETNDFWAGIQIGRNRGAILIGPGGTVMANTVRVGGVTKFGGDTAGSSIGENVGNGFVLTSGASLIVSNKIADTNKWLTKLEMSGASALTLHLNGTNTAHYVYATNLNIIAGASNVLNIGSVTNLFIPPEGTNIPVFVFKSGGADFPVVNMPSPMRGTIFVGPDIDATTHTADLNIITNEPRNLVWRGTGTAVWDKTASNWVDTATGLPARFVNGDNVLFDDLAGVDVSVNITTDVNPDTITVSNSANAFVLSGTGSILGGSLTKNGTGALAIDATTFVSVLLSQGTLEGVGSVSSAVVASGATLDFSGTISPSGVTCAGTATLRGNTIGTLTVQSGGIVTNANAPSGTTSGAFETQDGSLLYNVGNLGTSGIGIGSSTVRSNSTFINAGNIGLLGVNSTLAVSGVFKEMGVAGKDIYLTTLDINAGVGTNNNNAGTFIPGGDGIGATTILSPGIAGVSFSGRVRLGVGSTNIFKVDPGVPTNTVLRAPWIDYGPSIGSPAFQGGFIWATNVSVTPFAAGQSFGMFTYWDGTIPIQFGSTNSYPIMLPTVPGPGLVWDLNNVKLNGIVAIRSVATAPTNITLLSTTFTLATNANSTNRALVSTLEWPSNYTGWHVEEQTSTRQLGIQMGASNWSPLFASYFTNQIRVTNVIGSNNIGFFRLVSP